MGSWGEGASGGLAVGKLELRAFSSRMAARIGQFPE